MQPLCRPARAAPSTAMPNWSAPPSPAPRLTEGAVHMWRAELEDDRAGELGALVSSAERARAARIIDERRRRLWTRARGALRALLGDYLRVDPRSVTLTTLANGKPIVLAAERPAGARSAVSFNVSHAGAIALYGFVLAGDVGVDVEVARPSAGEVRVAERVLGRGEAERLGALGPEARGPAFLRAWTRHEASVKLTGVGLTALSRAPSGADGRQPWLADLDLGPGRAAAVALERAPQELRCFDWNARPH